MRPSKPPDVLRLARAATEVGLLGFVATIPFGRTLDLPIREGLLIASMLGIVGSRLADPRDTVRPSLGLVLPVAAFIASFVLSIVFSSLPALSFERSSFIPFALVLFIAAQDAISTPGAFRRLGWVVCGVLVLLGLDAVFQHGTGTSWLGGQPLFEGRITASVPHPNDLGVIAILMPLAVLVLRDPRLLARVVAGLGLGLGLVAVILSESRNAWLGLAVVLAILAIFGRQGRRIRWLAITGAVLFVVAIAADVADVRARLVTLADPLAHGRARLFRAAWDLFLDAPLVGVGSFVFGENYLSLLPTERWAIPWAHNLYLEALAERGLVGLVTFLAPVVAAGLRLRAFLAPSVAPERREAATGLAAAGCAFLAMGLFDLTFLKDWVLFVFLLLVALIARLDVIAGGSDDRPAPAAS